jgi:hypothetical protein
MNTAEQILVAFLATALAILLVLAIVAMVQIVKLVKILQIVATKAEDIIGTAESTADMVKSAVGQLNVLRFVQSVVETVTKHKSNK